MRELKELLEPLRAVQQIAENEYAPVLGYTIARSAMCIVRRLKGLHLIEETLLERDSPSAGAADEGSPVAAAPAPHHYTASEEEGMNCSLLKHTAATLGWDMMHTSMQTRRPMMNSRHTSRDSVVCERSS